MIWGWPMEIQNIEKIQVELNKLYGKRLVIAAWGIELVAASIGLFIGISSAISTIEYYQNLDLSVVTGNTFTNVFIGAAPFVIIAAVELTKIPLALGFYRVKRLVWRLVFFITLALLVFVTFETMFNGMERNFSALESKIQTPRGEYQEQNAILKNIDQTINEINARTLEQIDEEYAVKFDEINSDRRQEIRNLYQQRDAEISEITSRIQSLMSSFTVVADASGLEQSLERIRQDIVKKQNDAKELIQKENELADEKIENLDIQIQKIDENMTSELVNKGFLQSAQSIRNAAEKRREPLLQQRNQISAELRNKITRIETERDDFVKQKSEELTSKEADLVQSQGVRSGVLDKNLSTLQNQQGEISNRYAERASELNEQFNERIKLAETQKEETKQIQKSREESIPSLEARRLETRENIVRLENLINMAARENNIYRITGRFFDRESAAEIRVEELKIVTTIWFGSIALIAALVGPILALAGFVLQDPESYKPRKYRRSYLKNSLRGVFIRIRRFYGSSRKTGIIRRGLRGLIIDVRRWFRAPRIRFKEVKVPHEVVKEVPGPERVVYKEVPKEIVKNEIVYVPFYSVEDGVIMKNNAMEEKVGGKDE